MIAVMLALAGCQAPPPPCDQRADNQTFVNAGGICVAVATRGSVQRGAGASLVVLVDGRSRRGGPPTVIEQVAEAAVDDGVVSVTVARPGLTLASGRRSDRLVPQAGESADVAVADLVASAIQTLREHYGAGRVVLVGEGDGAVVAGLILGGQPGLVTDAVLVNCPCSRSGDVASGKDTRTLPIETANRVPPGTRVVLVAGDGASTSVDPMQRYIDSLAPRGVEARLVTLEAGADDADLAGEITGSVKRLLR